MGTPTKSQSRGKASGNYQASGHKSKGEVKTSTREQSGEVVDIVHDPGRTAPVAVVEYENGSTRNILAPENMSVGQQVEIGVEAEIKEGNTLPIREIPEGVPIHNIELAPNDGGKMVRSSGTYAFVVTHERGQSVIELPSGEFKNMNPDCRATIGKVAGSGRKDRPLMKAGNAHHKAKGRGHTYPSVKGVSMNAVDHPFGGSARPGQPKTVSRHSSPGSKSGSVAAKRSGTGDSDE
mgnify:CR=1 FL=1